MEGLEHQLRQELDALRRRLAEVEAESQQLALRHQELVTDSEARFSVIFRDAPVGILLVDPDGRTVMANATAARLLGSTQAELRGLGALELIHPENVAAGEPLFRELMSGRRDRYRFERRYGRHSSGTVWASVTVSLIRNAQGAPEYALALLEDVSERKLSEENTRRLLQEQAARAEAETARRRIAFLAEASVALTSSLDLKATLSRLVRLAVPFLGDVCLVNVAEQDGVLRVTEAAADPELETILREQPRALARRGGNGPVLDALRSGKTRLVASMDGAGLDNLGTPDEQALIGSAVRPLSVLAVPLIAAFRTLGVIVFSTTHPERAFTESDVLLAEEFARRAALAIYNARLYEDAREASRLKDDFLAIVSHELRTPLMPILGWSQLLRDGTTERPTLLTGLETIERNARSQARLIDDLLDVSRIMAGKLRLDVQPIHLPETIDAALESVRPAAKAKGIRLSVSFDAGVSQVMGDATRLQQVIWNLVSNGIKFTPSGGQVEVKLSSGSQDRVLLSVNDTGEGIRSDFIPHLFERFRQSEAASTRKHGGLGLGLSIVRHLVELHGGTVSASSSGPGQGATFTVSLPAAPPEHTPFAVPGTPEATAAPSAPRRPPRRLDGVTVLVVEDQPDTLTLLRQMLEGLGARVLTATSAAEATAQLEHSRPDVLVSDIGLPGDDGYALIQRIRALPVSRGGRVPAVALTAFARAEDRVRALDAGFQSHVSKPAEPAELGAVIASLVPTPTAHRAPKGTRKPKAPSPRRGRRRS